MINITTPQKDVVLSFFQNDVKLVKRYFMMISFDFDESFKYSVFKDFIFSAAGMMRLASAPPTHNTVIRSKATK